GGEGGRREIGKCPPSRAEYFAALVADVNCLQAMTATHRHRGNLARGLPRPPVPLEDATAFEMATRIRLPKIRRCSTVRWRHLAARQHVTVGQLSASITGEQWKKHATA